MSVEYQLVKLANQLRISIILNCPKCGQKGRLIRHGKTDVPKYRIAHGHGHNKRYCSFGYSSEWWDELNRIYKEVRENGGGYVQKKLQDVP